jgi:hypothetical protein
MLQLDASEKRLIDADLVLRLLDASGSLAGSVQLTHTPIASGRRFWRGYQKRLIDTEVQLTLFKASAGPERD